MSPWKRRAIAVMLAVIVALGALMLRDTGPPGFITMRLRGQSDMIYVPPGPFLCGGEVRPGHKLNVADLHTVDLPGFYIDTHLVTNAQYAGFVAATGHRTPAHWKDGKPAAGQDAYPVFGINKQDAEAYAAWVGKRLPTEEEWEKAARGTDGRNQPWGTEMTQRPDPLKPVGSMQGDASPYGVRDLITYGMEWTSTVFLPADHDPVYRNVFVAKGFTAYKRNAAHRNMVVIKTGEVVLLRCAADVPWTP